MASIILPRVFNSQPQYCAELKDGWGALILPSADNTLVNGINYQVNSNGIAYAPDNSTNAFVKSNLYPPIDFSYIIVGQKTVTADTGIFIGDGNNINNSFLYGFANGALSFRGWQLSPSNVPITGINNSPFCAVVSVKNNATDGLRVTVFANNKLTSSTGTTTDKTTYYATYFPSGDGLTVFEDTVTPASFRVNLLAFYPDTLDDAYRADLAVNPWQIFKPAQRRIWMPSAGGGGHTIAVGQVTETDSAQAVSRKKVKAFGQVVETDTVQTFTKRKLKVFGQSSEVDSAQAITVFVAGGPITVAVGQVSETDSAQAFTHRKIKAFGQVAESDTAQTLSKRKIKVLGQAVETDIAQGITVSGPKTVAVGQVTETDSAQAFTRFKRKAFGQALETDAVFAFSKRKVRGVGQVEETDSAQSITIIGGIPSDGWTDEAVTGGTGWAAASGVSGSWAKDGVESGTWVEESAL